jgi:hypothetical protein
MNPVHNRLVLTTSLLRISRGPSRRLGLGSAWQHLASRNVWSSRPLSAIDCGDKTLFQVVGVARSGTTLLSGLIDQQSGVVCVSEPYRAWFLRGSASYQGVTCVGHPSELLERLCRTRPERCIGVKETYFSADHGDGFANEEFFAANKKAGVTTVAILRDPRDVYASVEAAVGPRPEVPERFTNTWTKFSAWASADADCIVRYEELVSEPEVALERVCGTLGVTPTTSTEIRARVGEGDPRALAGGSVSSSSIGRFADRINAAKVTQIEDRCGRWMAELGYPVGVVD